MKIIIHQWTINNSKIIINKSIPKIIFTNKMNLKKVENN